MAPEGGRKVPPEMRQVTRLSALVARSALDATSISARHMDTSLYQCRGFFGARGYWLELDRGAAAIWWAEEPPHDVHGPG